MEVLVTGAAGFVGAHVTRALLARGDSVVAVDRLSAYYSPKLKRWRFDSLTEGSLPLVTANLANWPFPEELLRQFDVIVHLAAQPGVRLGLADADLYVQDNLSAYLNTLRLAAIVHPRLVLYASSSSVYGDSSSIPFKENEKVLAPLSIYGATKLANETLASVLSATLGAVPIGLRFFSVYGPWGRPDMAYWKAAHAIRTQTPFVLNGDGSALRDFTYIDDVVSSIIGLIDLSSSASLPPIINIGGSRERRLNELLQLVQAGMESPLRLQGGRVLGEDAKRTLADPELLQSLLGATPEVPLEEGIARFCEWYQEISSRLGSDWASENL